MPKKKENLLELYKIYIDTMERVSDRRFTSNGFYLTLNSILLSFSGFLSTLKLESWHFIIVLAGLGISILWFTTLLSFRNLNRCKFELIHKIENKLPIKLFKEEWDIFESGKIKYIRLSVIEQGIPILFGVLYLTIIILMLSKIC